MRRAKRQSPCVIRLNSGRHRATYTADWPGVFFLKAVEATLKTPDGRYLIVGGRLWRTANPGLREHERERLVHALMDARLAVKAAKASGDVDALATARRAVDSAKRGLGKRGPVDRRGAGLEPALGEELPLCGVVRQSC